MSTIRPHDTILFQGDSITDAGRMAPGDGLGSGYVAMVGGIIQALRPDQGLNILNRGVGGDRTIELLARWRSDCLDLKPDVLSIMIGVNDVWRKAGAWNGQTFVDLTTFTANLRNLLDQTKAAGIRQLVLMSPTTIEHQNDGELTRLVGVYGETVKRLSAEYGAVYVPTHEAMIRARTARPTTGWTTDGCHPTPIGHALLAATWLKATGLV